MRPLITSFILLLSLAPLSAQHDHFLPISDGTIHYQTFGDGQLYILIINGGPGMNSEGFIPLAREFGKRATAVLYDQRGTGQSSLNTLDSNTLTLDKIVEDLEAIRQHLGVANWVVFGHSFGGMLASYYATLHPDRLSGMILSASGGIDLALFDGPSIISHLSAADRDSLQYWSRQIFEVGDTSYYARLQRGRFLAPAYLYDQSHVETVAIRLTQGNMTINRMIWQDMRRNHFNCAAGLKVFQQPVLILQGEADVLDPQIAEKTHALLPNSKLVWLPECAHYGWLEQAELYFSEIDAFLASL